MTGSGALSIKIQNTIKSMSSSETSSVKTQIIFLIR